MLQKTLKTILLSCYLIIFLPLGSASAQETKSIISSSVSPALITLKLDKGESKSSFYEYVNGTNDNLMIAIDVGAFTPSDGEHGTPLFTDKDGKRVASPLTSWIKLSDTSMSVKKGEKARVNFEINTPSNAKEGKYYAVIFNTESSKGSDNGSLVKKELGVTLVVEILATKPMPIPTTNNWVRSNILSYIIFGSALFVLLLLIILTFKKAKKQPRFFQEEEKEKTTKKVKLKAKTTKKKK